MSSEKLSKQLESQLSEASGKISDVQRELGETSALKSRLQQQHVDLVHRLDEASAQLDQANKAKAGLTRQLEEAKQAVDDETAVRNKVPDANYTVKKVKVAHARLPSVGLRS